MPAFVTESCQKFILLLQLSRTNLSKDQALHTTANCIMSLANICLDVGQNNQLFLSEESMKLDYYFEIGTTPKSIQEKGKATIF